MVSVVTMVTIPLFLAGGVGGAVGVSVLHNVELDLKDGQGIVIILSKQYK